MNEQHGFVPEDATEFSAPDQTDNLQETTAEVARKHEGNRFNPKDLINKIGLSAALLVGPLMMSQQQAEAAQTTNPDKSRTTERTQNSAERIMTVSDYLSEPMFMKACTQEGSVQILKDLYGSYIDSETNKNGNTANYQREVTPEASMKLLNTQIGEILAENPDNVNKYDDLDTKAYAADIYKRIQEKYGKTQAGETLTRYYNSLQRNLFPNGFAKDPGVTIGKNKVLIPAYMMTNHDVLGVISSTMVESGVDQMIMAEKDLTKRSELVKIAIDNGMGLVTQGAAKSFSENNPFQGQ